MIDPVVLAVVTVPVIVFAWAGIVEFRRDRQSLRSPVRLVPFAAVLGAAIFLPVEILVDSYSVDVLSPDVVNRISTIMSSLSLLVGLSAFFCHYKSRSAASLIVFGGIVLAFLWLLNRYKP